MRPILERLEKGDVLLADGAMGTELIARGMRPGECFEAVNLERPGIPREIADLYADAGADIVLTNTFGASPLNLARHGLESRVEEINRAAVREAREGVNGRAYVAASCGPSGRLLKPYGDASQDEMRESFVAQISALAREGIDLICVETMTDLEEARIAVEAARAVAPSTPVAATMTFDPTPKGFRTVMGVRIEDAATKLAESGAHILGSNCGNGIEIMCRIAGEFRGRTNLPLLFQANAGIPEMRDGKAVYSETPQFFFEKSEELLRAGASIIGGCCGTTPDHIRALRRRLGPRK